jgi:heterodisulfide reductase subunit A-like polyferredoxin
MVPGWKPEALLGTPTAEDGFVRIANANIAPTVTVQNGIFAVGTATGPMDIVDSIMTAGAAAAEAAACIRARNGHEKTAPVDERSSVHA